MNKHEAFTLTGNGLIKYILTEVAIATPISHKQSKVYKALWDTGATGSVISNRIAQEIGLIPTGRITANGIHGSREVNTYIVDILLPSNVVIGNATVTESDNLKDFDALIGMDVICLGDFAFTNANGKSTFSFRIPSKERIDFVPETSLHNMKADGLIPNRYQ
ncbi:MAG: aspartyl protease family protein [Candidatus Cloacimonadales bacterium]|nr:aspartyl protease family protein [Candidatus Cloacimonadales bacterium]